MKTFTLASSRISRRVFLAASVVAPFGAKSLFALTQDQPVDPATLKPGEFSWKPERSPEGPVVILVSIPKQWVVIYRNGVQIAASNLLDRPARTSHPCRGIRDPGKGQEPPFLDL